MPHFVGELRYFQDCRPGDLIRVSHRGGNRFAFAVCGTATGVADRAIILDQADGAPLMRLDGGEIVVSYGRNYTIKEGMDASSLSSSSQLQPGTITWTLSNDGPEANIVATGERGVGFVSLDTGHVASPRGRPGFVVARWTVLLTLPNGSDPVVVFEATGKAT